MTEIEQDNNLGTINGRAIHARPNSVSTHKAKHTITREDLQNANEKHSATTLLDQEELDKEAQQDKKQPKHLAKEAIYTPDTTVLDFEGFIDSSVDDNKIEDKVEDKPIVVDGRIPVKKPGKSVKDKVIKKIEKPKKVNNSKLTKVSREQIKDSNRGNDMSTTVLTEEDEEPIKREPVKLPKKGNDMSTTVLNEEEEKPSKREPIKLIDKRYEKKIVKKSDDKKIVEKPFVDLKKESKQYKIIRLSNKENISIKGEKFVVGKSKHSNYQVNGNNTVSRSHAIFSIKKDGSLWIEDNSSKNGTCVDGIYIEAHDPYKLADGQTIRLSDEVFRVSIKE